MFTGLEAQALLVGIAALLAAVLSAASLLTGADYLSFLLPGGLPLGNLLAATVFCGLSVAAVLFAPRGSVARPLAVAALVGSVAWLPLSIALAGNVSLNFSGQRGLGWAWMSAVVFVCALGALLVAAGAAWRARRS